MARNNIGSGFGTTGDQRSERSHDRDAKRGNDAIAFAVFCREYQMQTPQGWKSIPEIRAMFDKERQNG